MSLPVPPNDALKDYCRICESPASHHKHHGAICCYSCRIFFRRAKGKTYKCAKGAGECDILGNERTKCRKCRFDKCLLVGMDASNVDTYVRIIPINKAAPNRENIISHIQKHDTEISRTMQPKKVMGQTYVNQEIKPFNVVGAVMEQHLKKDALGNFEVSLLEHPTQHDKISLFPVSNVLVNFINQGTKSNEQDMIEDSLSPTTINEQNEDNEDNDGMLLDSSENSWVIDHTADYDETTAFLNDSPLFLSNVPSDKRKLSYSTEEVCEETQSMMDQILPIKKQPRMQLMPYPVSTVIDRRIVPVVKFTMEEEFYFHEIEAKKGYFYDTMLDICKQRNTEQECIEYMNNMVDSMSKNQTIFVDKDYFDEELKLMEDSFLKKKDILLPQLSKCSPTFMSSMVNNTVKSFCLLECIPYYSKKATSYVEQMKMCEIWTPKIQTWTEENTPKAMTLRNVHVKEFECAISPWAVNLEDEEYFDGTMKELVEILDDDARLLTLLSFFVLVSPVSSMQTFENDALNGLRRNMLMMMYRYLASKDGFDWRTASEIVERLQGLIPRLYNAGQIFYNRRIPSCHPDDIPSYF